MEILTRKTTEIFRVSLNRLQPVFVNHYTIKKEPPGIKKSTDTEKSKKDTILSGSSKGSYQVPEYYQHNAFTFVDYDVLLQKQRLPQPSNRPK